ncbi:tRNA(Ile)-lysidine synthase [Nitrosomonas sp. Nm84]|uniref:tRNA lysidine(34) synthetase TilS n=1 Tax=Nitrosomonas sp. Nm84 TaxID=200124 RepID=UPI000D7528D3|nr:tRNA lysidine(34) synthetase TilS [Nitrosomonas sp. Nm84]PXW90843.1 tRNA(Ile)-lysidine synthase [Nitrosomonas sp. Nm84]
MAHIRKSKSNSLVCDTQKVLLAHIKQGSHLTIALSGGIDSIVLLHVLVTLSKQMQFTLSAVHVNHGISRNAVLWSRFCCDLCNAYGISIHVAYIHISKESGISLEAVARDERYRIFNHVQADYVVLAQHLDDQAETLLLQLFRGAGIKGLSAMPVVRKQSSDNAPQILRPLLEVSRSRIESYARQNKLNWINDESNDSITFDRNFLRHDILPVLRERYPNYPQTLLRTSRHLSEASLLLDELAVMDSEHCLVSGRLQIDGLRQLSFPRAKNLFRYTLLQQGASLPSTVKLEETLHQLLSLSSDNQFHISFGNTEIRCYQGAVYILSRKKLSEQSEQYQYIWRGEAFLTLQHVNGTIRFIQAANQGIDQQKILNKIMTVRSRSGGERFTPACNRPRRSLKNLLQEASIPPWERTMMPLLFCDDKLIWVPGIGIDCEFQVKSGELGTLPIWNPG